MTALTELWLRYNWLKGETKSRLIAIGKRVYHSLAHSIVRLLVVAGRIPTELGRLTALTELYLSKNFLTGECA